MKELIGKTVTAIFVSDDQALLKFVTSDGAEVVYETDADCCSETWFAEIIFSTNYDKFFPFTVKAAEDIEMPLWATKAANSDGRTRQDYDEVYGYAISTAEYRKSLEIIYRNSSNGYYGGSCGLMGDYKKQERLASAMWEKVEPDWTAPGCGGAE